MVTTLPVQSLQVGHQLDDGIVVDFSTLYLGETAADGVECVVAVRTHTGAVRALDFPWGTEVGVFS